MKTESLHQERHWIEELQQGNEAAFEALYDQYKAKLFLYCFRFLKSKELADEIVQEAFIKIWQKKETLNSRASFNAFLFRIAKNLIIDYFRKAALHHDFEAELQYKVQLYRHHPEEEMIYKDLERLSQAAIRKLPAHRQRIFRMSREKGMSYEEIAQTLSISPNTVKEQIARSLKSIREQLLAHGDLSFALLMALQY